MKKTIIILTTLLIVFVITSSVAGSLAFFDNDYREFTTVRGNKIKVQHEGLYKYNVKALAAEGVGWDIIRLFVSLPLLVLSFIFYLKGSVKAFALFAGSVANLFYQYLMWALGWSYNPLFLIYVASYSISAIVFVLLLLNLNKEKVSEAFDENFPVKRVATLMFSVSFVLIMLWGKEIIPTIASAYIPKPFHGNHTLIAQALDLGIIVPFGIIGGILILKKNIYGYILSPIALMFLANMGLAIMAGAILSGIRNKHYDITGMIAIGSLSIVGLMLLIYVLGKMKSEKPV